MASRFLVPFTSSRGLVGSDPLLELHREMNRLFDDVFRGFGSLAASPSQAGAGGGLMTTPRLDVQETDSELSVTADLPGVTQSDVDLRLDGDVLTISGERKNEKESKQQNFHLVERSVGRFQRSIQLPFAPDAQQVNASFDNGVLTIRMPKPTQAQTSQRIEVRSGGGAMSGSATAAGGSDTVAAGMAGASEGGRAGTSDPVAAGMASASDGGTSRPPPSGSNGSGGASDGAASAAGA